MYVFRNCVFIGSLLLIGCTSTSYDIDLKCKNGRTDAGNPYFRVDAFSRDRKTETLTCYWGEYFKVKCASNTSRRIDDEYFCTTHDGKSVRVQLEKEDT